MYTSIDDLKLSGTAIEMAVGDMWQSTHTADEMLVGSPGKPPITQHLAVSALRVAADAT